MFLFGCIRRLYIHQLATTSSTQNICIIEKTKEVDYFQLPLPLNNWNAIPKNFATNPYEAGNRIQQRSGGREISLDQSSLGRPADEVLYWKAPKEVLGDVVTLYDGNIDVHFTNDAANNQAASDSEFLWLRGNNIDLIHKIPSTQQLKANTNATYSVPVNEV